MAKNTKGKKTVESVAETLCSFSRFLCDLVIGIYLFVILLYCRCTTGAMPRSEQTRRIFLLRL